MTVETIKMLEKGTVVDFYLTMNPRLRQGSPFRGVVINYPRGQFTQKIHTKTDKVIELPVILVRVKAEKGEFRVDARGVKAVDPAKATEEDLQKLQAVIDE